MTTLITGAGGYVGVNLAQTLLERARDVVLFDAQPLPAATARVLASLPGRFRFVQGDIRDSTALDAACTGVDGAIHCAAITSGPEREAAAPASVFEVNVGHFNMACRVFGFGYRALQEGAAQPEKIS